MSWKGLLSPEQIAIAERVLREEEGAREHLVVSLCGAHAYGFPSPDSDLDLKAIHVAPTRALLGLRPPQGSASRMEFIDGVEIDYSSNEIGPVLVGVLQGNGNYLERILGALVPLASADLAALAPIVRRSLSRRLFHHYAGFARGQLRALDAAEKKTAKNVLYVLRTARTGTHLLRTGELITDLGALLDDDGFADARALIAAKRAGERSLLTEGEVDRWRGSLQRALELLDQARDHSPLPDEPPNADELEHWLLDLRRNRFP
jgi:uncharacterized protein